MVKYTELSLGVVPLCIIDNMVYVCIVQHLSGAWLLPKGHALEKESKMQTAQRELKEETGLTIVRWLDHEPFVEQYTFYREGRQIYKQARYYPALVTGKLCIQIHELLDGKWITIDQFQEAVTFSEMKRIAQEVYYWIMSTPTFAQ